MNAEKFAELRGLVARATGGIWRQVEARPTEIHAGPQVVAHVFGSAKGQPLPKQANAALIVAAVNALPALLTERDSLLEENQKLKDEVEALRTYVGELSAAASRMADAADMEERMTARASLRGILATQPQEK